MEKKRHEEWMNQFHVRDGKLESWTGTDTCLKIPEGIAVSIGAAFKGKKTLKAVEIPESVTAVDDFAFQDCRNLKRVVFPSTLEKIGESAFENCTKLEEVTMQEGLTTLQDKAFCNCRSLKSVYLPGSVRHFGKGVFERCENLSQVSGDKNVPWQGKGAFIRTPWLQTKAQDSYVLYDGSLELYADTEVEVRVPMAKTICKYAFAENPCIEKVYIHEGTETIEEMAFANCKKLRFIYIPASVTYIAENAFSGNTDFVISCHRGSVASSFRIRNKIPGEYVKKEKEKPATPIERKRSGTASGRSDLSGLSEDEFCMVMEIRRAKLAEKEARKVELVQEEKGEYTVASDSAANVSSARLALCEDSRKITNNIFSLSFQQLAPAENPDEVAEFDIFVIDQNGKIVSDQKVISAGRTKDERQVHKVSMNLNPQEQFNKNDAYFVILRGKGDAAEVISKTKYTIDIAFTSDFEF